MAIIPQLRLFGWNEIEQLADLERLRLVLEYMPDEDLMRLLEEKRGNGRDDYPVRAMWNSVLAGIVFQHDAIEKLRRELGRNLLTGKDNVVYNYKGNVYCYCPKTQTRREMGSGGFEKDRNTLKKLCPAEHYGIECIGRAQWD